MIHVEYEKKNNYPHDRELIMFDRNAFQSLGDEGLRKVNEKYNVLCPQVFVMECLAPNNTDKKPEEEFERVKKALREKMGLIENPIVLEGERDTSELIFIPRNSQYPAILTSEEIAQNCITNAPITMRGITPKQLILHYEHRVGKFMSNVKGLTRAADVRKGSLTPNKLSSTVKNTLEEEHNIIIEKRKIKKHINVTQEPEFASKETLQDIKTQSKIENVRWMQEFLFLNAKEVKILNSEFQERKSLTPENYPRLAYPIYIYYLINYMFNARLHNTEHFDQSYVRDIRYLYYLNFCDMFIANEKSTQYIVNSLPFNDIRETPVITAEELKKRLN